MSLTPGTRLGPYEIQSALGAGGMGEVYRARDTRLERSVAIKVLPEALASDPQFRERFDREARVVAGLNHPHICTLHDIGREGAVDYLVMELLEGETLDQRLKRSALTVDQALQIGMQIADALAAAHRAGVVHRDLKPGNVILTKAGAKLLDFGLAKTGASVAAGSGGISGLPTTPPALTQQGTILGTFQYMAPEQVEGQEADARSDIFALGCVLYEMVTGRRAFEGKTAANVMAAILEREPPAMSAVQPMTPLALDRLVRKCLRKDPDARWQRADDIIDELRWIAESTPHAPATATAARSARNSALRLAWVGAAVVVLAVLAVAASARFMGGSAPASVVSPVRFTVGPPENGYLPAANTQLGFLSVSPDGTRLVFAATDASGRTQLWIRALDATAATPLAGSDGGGGPFWSPDGRFVAFVAEGKLKKVAVSGGPAQTVAEPAGAGYGGAWSPSGVIIFARGNGPLYSVSDAGGTSTPATELDAAAGELLHTFPNFLPDGEHYLFLVRNSNLEQSAVYVGALNSKERTRVLAAASNAVYVQPGYLLFHRDGTLMAQPFDAGRLATTGEAVPVVEDVQFSSVGRMASFAVSHTGVLAYRTATGASPRTLVWVSRNGTETSLPAPPRGYQQPRLSPDGRRVAVQIEERDSQIWVYDTARETLTRLTFQGSQNELAIWAPDGKRVTYYSNQSGPLNLFWQTADGSGAPERLTTSEGTSHAAMSWSPDGRRLAFTNSPSGGDRDIWVLDLTDRKAAPFIKTSFVEGGAQFSPDGRWVAYVSNESGRAEVYVQPYPGPGGKWQVSTDGGSEPVWSRNGRELFYRGGDRMMAVPVSTQGGFSSGRPQMLFERRYASTQLPQTGPYYDVLPDGQRFLVVKETAQPGTPINVVLNWQAQFNARAPAGN